MQVNTRWANQHLAELRQKESELKERMTVVNTNLIRVQGAIGFLEEQIEIAKKPPLKNHKRN